MAALDFAFGAARGAGFCGFIAAHRRPGRAYRRSLHRSDRAAGHAALSGRQRRLEACAHTRGRLSDHGLPALSLLPQCARQRRAPGQGGTFRPRRVHLAAHGAGQVLLHGDHPRQRHSARPRGTICAGRGRHRVRARPPPGIASGKGKGPAACGSFGGHCGGLQHAHGGGAVLA